MMIRPRRSALYMPGSNSRAIEKAKTLDADVVMFDLEDAVAPDAKVEARQQVVAAVTGGDYGRRELVVRINGLDTGWGGDDLSAAAAAKPDALLLPKVEQPEQLREAAAMIKASGGACALWAMIETPRAIVNLADIARCGADPDIALACFVIGTNDLVKDTRARLDRQRTAALYWLSSIVTAARAFDIDVLDGVYNNFKDPAGYEAECRQGRMLGMDGKTLIHPSQIDAANATFSPSAEEVAQARKILDAFALPQNRGKGVISLDGEMVELLHADMAKRTVAIANAIGM